MYDPSSSPGAAIGSAAGRGHDARRALALAGETFAALHLEHLGYELVARNHRTRFGELDIVARDASTLVFVEVKTRRASASASSEPWQSLHERKRAQVRKMAAAYLAEVADRPRGLELRCDAIAVAIDAHGRLVSIDHLEGAF
jgi:putative endonuclease